MVKNKPIYALMLVMFLSSLEVHGLDQYWGKVLAGFIGTVGLVTTLFKKDIYGLYLGATVYQDPEIKKFYAEYYKDKKFSLSEIWNGHKFLREMRSKRELRTLINLHRLGVHAKKAYDGCIQTAQNLTIRVKNGLNSGAGTLQNAAYQQAQALANGFNASAIAISSAGQSISHATQETTHALSTTYNNCSAALQTKYNQIKDETKKNGEKVKEALIQRKTALEILAARLSFSTPKSRGMPIIELLQTNHLSPELERKVQNFSLKQRQQLGILYLAHTPKKAEGAKQSLKPETPLAFAKNRAYFSLRQREHDYNFEKSSYQKRTAAKKCL